MEEIHQICSRKNGNWRCKNVSGDNKLQYCDKHYKKKKEIEEKKKLPSDEQFCCVTGGGGWRCKNLRMSHGAAADHTVPKSKQCEKHYYYYANYSMNLKEKKRSGDGEETRGPKRRRERVTEENEIQKLRAISYNDTSVTIIEDGGTANIWTKRKYVQRTKGSGEPQSSKRSTREPVVDLARYKSKCSELSVEFEKKKLEFTKLQGVLAEVIETRKTSGTEETEADATECWKKMFLDLERRVLRMEYINSKLESLVRKVKNENLATAGCVESGILDLESQVRRNGKESSILACVKLRNADKIVSQTQGLQNDVTQSDEKQRDETRCGGKEYSHVYELNTKEEVLNMYENDEEGKGWGCSEERPTKHGSSSQDHLEMTKKPFVNLVSDDDSGQSLAESENSDSSADTETSLGELMDMLAMKYSIRNEDHGDQTARG